jgi:hypothetical protein
MFLHTFKRSQKQKISPQVDLPWHTTNCGIWTFNTWEFNGNAEFPSVLSARASADNFLFKNNNLFHTLRDRMLNQCPSWEHDITHRLL